MWIRHLKYLNILRFDNEESANMFDEQIKHLLKKRQQELIDSITPLKWEDVEDKKDLEVQVISEKKTVTITCSVKCTATVRTSDGRTVSGAPIMFLNEGNAGTTISPLYGVSNKRGIVETNVTINTKGTATISASVPT